MAIHKKELDMQLATDLPYGDVHLGSGSLTTNLYTVASYPIVISVPGPVMNIT